MATTDYSEYDSSKFPDIIESINHAITNPFLYDNSSNIIVSNIESDPVILFEPLTIFKEYADMFKSLLVTRNIPNDEFYLPELTSYRMYNSHDFWYLFLLWNNILSSNEYNQKSILVLPAEDLYKVQYLLQNVVNKTTVFEQDKYTIYK